jgi:membrane fusion protein (multidrug efflux system)
MTAVALKESAERPKTVVRPRNRGRLKRAATRFALLVLVPLAVLALGIVYYLSTGRYVSTDNAYVGSQRVLITPDVSGKIVKIAVQEGQHDQGHRDAGSEHPNGPLSLGRQSGVLRRRR